MRQSPTERFGFWVTVLAIALSGALAAPGLAQNLTQDQTGASTEQQSTQSSCSANTNSICDMGIAAGAEPTLTADEVGIEVIVTNLSHLAHDPVSVTATPPAGADAQTKQTPPGLKPEQQATLSFTFARQDAWEGKLAFVVSLPADENADNNSVSIPVDFGGGPVPTRAPDIALSPGNPPGRPRGRSIEIAVQVANQGPRRASAEISVSAPASWGAQPKSATAEKIAPKDSSTVQVVFAVPDTARGGSALFVATTPARPGETDTLDNTARIPVDIPAAAPDLTVRGLQLTQDDSSLVRITATIRNVGSRASDATTSRARARGRRSSAVDVRSLEPGQDIRVGYRVPIGAAARGQHVRFVVAVEAVAAETVRANNRARITADTLADQRTGGGGSDGGSGGGASSAPLLLIIGAVVAALAAALLYTLSSRRPRTPPPHEPHEAQPSGLGGERRIITGFASADEPDRLLGPGELLVAGQPCYFCVEIGPPVVAESPADPVAALDVFVFALTGDLELPREAAHGVIELVPGTAAGRVSRQPGDAPARGELAQRRLLFPLSPQGPGELRCSLCCRGVLVWSQRVSVPAGADEAGDRPTPSAVVDFGIAPRLVPGHLARLQEHQLSMMLNSTSDATHVLTIVGDASFHPALVLDPLHLQQMLDRLRGALRVASWGESGEWSEGRPYMYESSRPEQLQLDMARLAVRSRRFYQYLSERLTAAGWDWKELRERMRGRSVVQLAIKESPTHLIPMALIYDRPLDDTFSDFSPYQLCPAFLDACRDEPPLEDTACFNGACPSWGEETIVCPSGFWGFRHNLGATVSTRASNQADIVEEIRFGARPEVLMAVSTDSRFEGREPHELVIRKLCDGGWHHVTSRRDALAQLNEGQAHLVYFYCHGNLQNDNPTLQIGEGPGSLLTPSYLSEHGRAWSDPRPLVVVNGCRTVAVEPRNAVNFVSVWLAMLRAAGVVGTEITVFEPLATAFAERCLRLFLSGVPLGEAVRRARLELLKDGNPLGLAYVPFALAGLRLAPKAAPGPSA